MILMGEKSVAKVTGEFIGTQRNEGKSEGTIKTYTRILNEFIEWLQKNQGDIQQLTRIDVQQYINYLQKKGNSAWNPSSYSTTGISKAPKYCTKIFKSK